MVYAIIGLTLLVLFLCAYIAYLKGYRIAKQGKPNEVQVPKEEAEKAQKLQKEFEEVMNYNLTKALERKRT